MQHLSTLGDGSLEADVSISSPLLERVNQPRAHPSHLSPLCPAARSSPPWQDVPRPQLSLYGDIQRRSGIAGGSEGSQSHLWGGQRKYNPDAGQGPDLLSTPLRDDLILEIISNHVIICLLGFWLFFLLLLFLKRNINGISRVLPRVPNKKVCLISNTLFGKNNPSLLLFGTSRLGQCVYVCVSVCKRERERPTHQLNYATKYFRGDVRARGSDLSVRMKSGFALIGALQALGAG